MWKLPDDQGDSLKQALKFLLKHTNFYKIRKTSWNKLTIFLYILYTFEKTSLKWRENLPDSLFKLITYVTLESTTAMLLIKYIDQSNSGKTHAHK